MDHKTTFPLLNGSTRNVADNPTKILGHTVAISQTLTSKSCVSKVKTKVLSAVQRIDDRPIRGELDVEELSRSLLSLPSNG